VLLPSREKSTTFNSVNYHYQQLQEKHRSKKQQKIDKKSIRCSIFRRNKKIIIIEENID